MICFPFWMITLDAAGERWKQRDQLELYLQVQKKDRGGLDGYIQVGSQKWSYSGSILNVKLSGFGDRSDVRCERKTEVRKTPGF